MVVDTEFVIEKRAAARARIRLNIGNIIEAGDSIASVSVIAAEHPGGAAASGVISDPLFNGTNIIVTVRAGEDGKDYLLKLSATTAAGDILPLRRKDSEVLMRVRGA